MVSWYKLYGNLAENSHILGNMSSTKPSEIQDLPYVAAGNLFWDVRLLFVVWYVSDNKAVHQAVQQSME